MQGFDLLYFEVEAPTTVQHFSTVGLTRQQERQTLDLMIEKGVSRTQE